MELGFYVRYGNVLFHVGIEFKILLTLRIDEGPQRAGVDRYQVGDLLYACGELDWVFV